MADEPASRPDPSGTDNTPYRQPYPEDTVSLRELYLVLRRGLGLIIGVAALCGLLALAYKLFQGSTYTAQAVVQVVRPRVSNQPGSGLEVSIGSVVDSGTYRAVAESETTLAEVAARVDLGGNGSVSGLTIVPGPGPQSGDAMTITHEVTVDSAAGGDKAAELANAWAEVTVEAVRRLVTAPLSTAAERVSSDVEARERAYQEASEAWANFLGIDEREEIRRRLDALVDLDAATLAQLGEVEARAQGIRARVAADAGAEPDLRSELVSLDAQAEHLRGELEASAGRADDLRARLGELEREAAQLQRRVSAASLSYFRAAPAAAEIELQRDLAAGSVGVAIPAAEPQETDERNVTTTVIMAAVIGALFATLFVFLRAAVREPAAA